MFSILCGVYIFMHTYNVSLSGFVPSTGKRGYYNNIARLLSTPHPKRHKINKNISSDQTSKTKTCFWLCMNKQIITKLYDFFWILVYVYCRSTLKIVRKLVIFKIKYFCSSVKKTNGKRMTK